MKESADFVNSEKRKNESIIQAKRVFQDLHLEGQISDDRQLIFEVEAFNSVPPCTKEDRQKLPKQYKIYFFNDIILIWKSSLEKGISIKKFSVGEVTIGRPVGALLNRFRLDRKAYFLEDAKLLLKMFDTLAKYLKELQIFKEDIEESVSARMKSDKKDGKYKKIYIDDDPSAHSQGSRPAKIQNSDKSTSLAQWTRFPSCDV